MLNSVSLVGSLASVPEDLDSGAVSCRLCLEDTGKDGQTYRTYVPVEAFGQAANVMREAEDGDLLAITGRLMFRTLQVKGEKRGMLKVACWQASKLSRQRQAEAVA